jgi:molybdopterin biosynthesis enzyme
MRADRGAAREATADRRWAIPYPPSVADNLSWKCIVHRKGKRRKQVNHYRERAANFAMQRKAGVRQFLLAHVRRASDGASMVVPCEKQGAAALSTLAIADGFMVLAEDCRGVQPGDLVEYLPLEALLG